MNLSKRVQKINPSPTLAITAKAKQLQAQGINIVGFGAGEPDCDTPAAVKEAAKAAMDKGFTKYTPTSGIKELKDAIRKKFKDDNGLDYAPDEILVSCGAKHSLFNAILALCDEGDEVLIPSPFWVSYEEMVKVAGGKPVFIPTSAAAEFKIKPEQLERAVNSRTKLLILNSPSNPTGMVYTESELRALGKIVLAKKICCISDEIYEKILYDGAKHVSIAALDPGLKALTLVVNGVSKSHSMTGWRIGYAAGPKPVIQAMSNLQDHSTSNPSSISQYAALQALSGDQAELIRMVAEFKKRRDVMVAKVNSIPGLEALTPNGAFYCFFDAGGLFGKSIDGAKITGSLSLTELLLEKARVAVVPGIAFGEDRCIRLSYATSMKNIEEGLNRIEQFVKKLS